MNTHLLWITAMLCILHLANVHAQCPSNKTYCETVYKAKYTQTQHTVSTTEDMFKMENQ